MMKRILIALAVVVGVVGLLLAGCAYFSNHIMVVMPLPREQKLSEITSDAVAADIVWPNAEPGSYQLVVGLQTNRFAYDRPCPTFAGVVTVTGSNGSPVEQFPVSSTNVTQCNWLSHKHGLDGFILTWKQTNVLRSSTAGTQYKIGLNFEKRPEEFTSFWLCYLQSQKQKNESTNIKR
jgi:hypothetical protein